VFGSVGFLLLTHWLISHWLFDPEGDASNIELIAWFVFTIISVRLGLVFGIFEEDALDSDRSEILLTTKWFLLVTVATFICYLIVGALIVGISRWMPGYS